MEAQQYLQAWLKLAHLAALLAWCAALFALPALLASFPSVHGRVARQRLLAATRFTYIAIGSPAAVLAIATGTGLIFLTAAGGPWLVGKLTLVAALSLFHAGCGKLILVLHRTPRRWPRRAHLALAAVPLALVPGVLWLVLAQPAWGR